MFGPPIAEAHFITLFIGSTIYGFHLFTFGYCMQTLICTTTRWKKKEEIRWRMLIVSVALFANSTFCHGLDLYYILQAFVFLAGGDSPMGPMELFTDISNWLNVVKPLSVVIQVMIGNAVLVWRCWIVYEGSVAALSLPIILWVGCLATSIWLFIVEGTLHTHALLYVKELRPSGSLFWFMSVVLNSLATGLLIRRIWRVESFRKNHNLSRNVYSINSHESSPLNNVIRIIIGSGMLCTTSAIISFVTYTIKSNWVYVSTSIDIQAVGIAFNLIIIRISCLSVETNTWV